MRISNNQTIFIGENIKKENQIKEGQHKKEERTDFFAGNLNQDLFENKLLEKKKEAIPAVLSGLQSLLRDALVIRQGCTLLRSTDPATAQLLAHRLSDRQVIDLLAVIEELQTARLYNMNYTLFLTLLCSRLRRAAGR